MKPVQIPVTLDSANRRKDKSVRLSFSSTFEMNTPDFAELDLLMGDQGWLLFKSNTNFETHEIPKEDAPADGKKPSVRLRAVIYRFWEQQTDQSEPFDYFYQKRMENIINQFKDKLI
jgi:hypothetical protein